MLHSRPRETDWLQTGCDRQSFPPSSGNSQSSCLITWIQYWHASWFSCVDYRCCVLLVLVHALFNRSYDLCVVTRCFTFVIHYFYMRSSELAELSCWTCWSDHYRLHGATNNQQQGILMKSVTSCLSLMRQSGDLCTNILQNSPEVKVSSKHVIFAPKYYYLTLPLCCVLLLIHSCCGLVPPVGGAAGQDEPRAAGS